METWLLPWIPLPREKTAILLDIRSDLARAELPVEGSSLKAVKCHNSPEIQKAMRQGVATNSSILPLEACCRC